MQSESRPDLSLAYDFSSL